MKLHASTIILLALFLLVGCSNDAGGDNSAANNKAATNADGAANAAATPLSEKNKQIAIKNEVTRAVEAAQRLEKQGRQMDSYRLAADAASRRSCKTVEEDLQREVKDLETKINGFPEDFAANLSPFVGDLHVCVSCAPGAAASCVKARASVNEAIRKIYAQ